MDFWGSKRTSGSSGSKRVAQDASPSCTNGKAFFGSTLDNFGRSAKKPRIPFVAWGDELSSLKDTISTLTRRHSRSQQKRCSSRRETSQVRRSADGRNDGDSEYESSMSQARSFCSERRDRMERNLKIGLAQLAILHKWEASTRELASRWVAWLLKMLRKARPHPRPLQHLLFTMCSAVIPVICRNLIRESWAQFPDSEVCKCVDIFLSALEKSSSCFSLIQWEILEEKMDECRKLHRQVASLLMKKGAQTSDRKEKGDAHTSENKVKRQSWTLEPGEKQERTNIKMEKKDNDTEERVDDAVVGDGTAVNCSSDGKDEQFSSSLVKKEGVPALVKRALREKLYTPRSKMQEGKATGDLSGCSGTVVSLMCPLTGSRLKVPARGRSCSHRASFDLQAYLEVGTKDEVGWSTSTHVCKRQKTERSWRCPICGSDATWPQIIVDKVLLRILEVLPENMPQVCLLPNGRWRVVWSPVTESNGKTDSSSARFSLHSLSRCGLSTEGRNSLHTRDLYSEAMKDGTRRSSECRCETDWVALDMAVKSWKEGIDQLSRGGNAARHCENCLGRRSLVSSRDGYFKLWTDTSASIRPERTSGITRSNGNGKGEVADSAGMKPRSAVDDDVVPIFRESGKRTSSVHVIRKSIGEEFGVHVPSATPIGDGETGVMATKLRVGQFKARRKQMAKKN